jgi:hypothetical protein
MAAKNDITGDSIASKVPSQKFLDNFDTIFRKNKQQDKQIAVFNQAEQPATKHELSSNETADINK